MFRNILVPVEGTAFAEHAVPWALAAAGRAAAVHLVHVHVAPVPLLVEGVVVADPTLDRSIREQEAGYLDGLAGRVRAAAPGLTVAARNVEADDPLADALARAVADTAADLVVMAHHARGRFARFWLGSVADDFLRRSPVPVLFLRADDGPVDFTARPRLDRLVVPLDRSDLAATILGPAAAVASAFGASVGLVLVLEAGEDSAAAEAYLDGAARTLAGRGVAAAATVVRHAPSGAVLELAAGRPTTGVALATRGRSGVGRLLMGSVADEVVRHAAGPVLVYHPPG